MHENFEMVQFVLRRATVLKYFIWISDEELVFPKIPEVTSETCYEIAMGSQSVFH